MILFSKRHRVTSRGLSAKLAYIFVLPFFNGHCRESKIRTEVGNERQKNKEKKHNDDIKLSLRLVTHNTNMCAGMTV